MRSAFGVPLRTSFLAVPGIVLDVAAERPETSAPVMRIRPVITMILRMSFLPGLCAVLDAAHSRSLGPAPNRSLIALFPEAAGAVDTPAAGPHWGPKG